MICVGCAAQCAFVIWRLGVGMRMECTQCSDDCEVHKVNTGFTKRLLYQCHSTLQQSDCISLTTTHFKTGMC